jgi:hypothetical protein
VHALAAAGQQAGTVGRVAPSKLSMMCSERGNTSTALCLLVLLLLMIGSFAAVIAFVDHNTAITRVFFLSNMNAPAPSARG